MGHPDHWPDLFRLIVLAGGTFLIGFAIAVMVEARKFRAPPKHVLFIAASYVLLIVAEIAEIMGRWGGAFTWRTALGGFAFAFGLYAMRLMWQAYIYASRMRRHEKATIKEGNRLMGVAFRRKHGDEPGEDRRSGD